MLMKINHIALGHHHRCRLFLIGREDRELSHRLGGISTKLYFNALIGQANAAIADTCEREIVNQSPGDDAKLTFKIGCSGGST